MAPEYPSSDDPLVTALQKLLAAHGGHQAVAARAHVNDQSLYQIAFCKTDSKTQKAKGVGPSIRRRLDAAYPGWLDAAAVPQAHVRLPATPSPLARQLAERLDQLVGDPQHHQTAYAMAVQAIDGSAAVVAGMRAAGPASRKPHRRRA